MTMTIPQRNPDSRTTKNGCVVEVYTDRHETIHVIRGENRQGIIDDLKRHYPVGGYGTAVAFDSDEEGLTIVKRGNSCE